MLGDLSERGIPKLFVTAGEMGKVIRDYPWNDSKLGPMDSWPQSLRSALSICLNSNFPIAIYWGPDLVLIYNDAWSPIPGNKHPWALGKPAIEVWPEIWSAIEPQFEKAFTGIPGGSKDALLPMQRHGYTEECYFDFTFTPVYGESGKVEGIFNAVIETTYRVINERRALLLQRLSDAINSIPTPDEVFAKASVVLNEAKADVSYYCIIEFGSGDTKSIRVCSQDVNGIDKWPLDKVLENNIVHISDIREYGLHFPENYWPETPTEAVLLPLRANDNRVFGCIIAGLSARRQYDKDYRTFFESLATIISGELNTIRSLDDERRRAEALAEIDKAKTIFFSNISHEFRTPLTLMTGPLANMLADGKDLPSQLREDLSTAYRNTLRLQKLVNTLLDFSRIEAGKMEAKFVRVNLGKVTRDLASSFRSAIESAGIEYTVEVKVDAAEVRVDPDMWEKIVLNLISNAFKYTNKGKIEVRMAQRANLVTLAVSDTGIGISTADQDKIFERFYRVNNSDGRSQEGTGIGLSMVKELVHLHSGAIKIESEPGKGSVFTVSIPAAESASGVDLAETPYPKESVRSHFMEEINQWNARQSETNNAVKESNGKATRHRVLVADDNSDMRSYVQRLLQDDFDVTTVTNGEEAFARALEWIPDLVLTDIMMPKLDGFGLLQKLKSSLITRSIPVIFLSARAGEEAKVEGITAGADDYLVKPFSAKELVARVTNQILISRTRRLTEKEFYNLFLQVPAHIHVMKGPEHVVEFFHPLGKKFLGGRDITGMKMKDALPEVDGQKYFEMLDQVYNEGKSFNIPEAKVTLPDQNGVVTDTYFNISYLPLKGQDDKIEGVLQFTIDVTQQAEANRRIRESEERFKLLVSSIPQIIWISDNNSNIEFLSEQWEIYTGVHNEDGRKKYASFIHADDVDAVRQKWFEALKLREPWRSEYRLVNARTGEYRWFFGQTFPLKDNNGEVLKWIGSASDIHIQKTANERLEGLVFERTSELVDLNKLLKRKNDELSRAQIFLQTVLDSSVELVTAFDKQLNYTFVNNRVKDFTSLAADQLVGKNLLAVEPGFENTERYQHMLQALKGETIHLPARRPHVDKPLVFETFIIPLKRNAEVTGVVVMQRDITAIIELTENLKVSNERLRQSNEDLQQFAHVASHDLKEPVRKIKMYGNILGTSFAADLPEKAKGYLDRIERATGRISDMIDGVLQYSSMEAFDDAFEPVNLNTIITSIKEDLEVVVEESGAAIHVAPLPVIQGSPVLIHQLFYNLVNNSLKFRKAGIPPVITITVSDGRERQREGSPAPGDFITINIQDNGIGFDQVYAQKIFESFSRLNAKDKYEGTGLGLALCKKIALRHKGFLTANGVAGQGATFSIHFPKSLVNKN